MSYPIQNKSEYLRQLYELEREHPSKNPRNHPLTPFQRLKRKLGSEGLKGVFLWFLKQAHNLKQDVLTSKNDYPMIAVDIGDTFLRGDMYFSHNRIAVYTALFSKYDTIKEPQIHPDNIDYFIYTDQSVPEKSLWKKLDHSSVIPAECIGDPVLCNRWIKMHPHLLFPEYDYSIYIDSSITVLSDLTPMIKALDHYPVATFKHKSRKCVYEEIEACRKLNKATDSALNEHLSIIRARGIPKDWGLAEAPVISRKHNDALCKKIMDKWWECFFEGPSRRDQIALIDCLWQLGIEPSQLTTLGESVSRCCLFNISQHDGDKT